MIKKVHNELVGSLSGLFWEPNPYQAVERCFELFLNFLMSVWLYKFLPNLVFFLTNHLRREDTDPFGSFLQVPCALRLAELAEEQLSECK